MDTGKTIRYWMGVAVLFGLGLTAGCNREIFLDKKSVQRNLIFKEILQHEDRRDFDDAAYWQSLMEKNDDAQLWERALLALARIGDPRALRLLEGYARHSEASGPQHPSASSSVRAAAAFAIGEIEDRATRESVGRFKADAPSVDLLIEMTQDSALWVRARAAEALGKIGDPRAVPAVLARLPKRDADHVLSPAEVEAAGLVLTALFRLEDQNVLGPVLALADHPQPDIRWQVGNCVYRLLMKNPGAQAAAVVAAMSPRLKDTAPMVRGYAARALSVTKEASVVKDVIPQLNDPEFFVQVEAVNALGRLPGHAAVDPLRKKLTAWLESLRNPRALPKPRTLNLAVAMVDALGNIGDADVMPLLNRFRFRLDPVSNAAEIAAAKILKGKADFFGRHVRHIIEVRAYWMRFNTQESLRAAVTALGEHGSEEATRILRDIMEQEKDEDRLIAKTRPWILRAMGKLNPPDLEVILRRHLSDPDDVTRRIAAEEIGKLKDRAPVSSDVRDALIQAYTHPAPDTTAETKRELVTALAKLYDAPTAAHALEQALRDQHQIVRARAVQVLAQKTGRDYSGAIGTSETHVLDTVYMLAGRRNVTLASVETTRGRLEIELFPEEAPLTVHNFTQLAEKGVFNHLSFMRVVPNFVVQTGDPRNDMEGGPGYTIRCEINRRPYLRGSVGMALSGKDTGGSQFFIALSPQPHLDGGYTVFGRVLTGMDIVDNLVPGDKILSVGIREIQARD